MKPRRISSSALFAVAILLTLAPLQPRLLAQGWSVQIDKVVSRGREHRTRLQSCDL